MASLKKLFRSKSSEKRFEQIVELKLTSKQLVNASVQCERDHERELLRVKTAMQKGNMDGAKIYAQNAIRKRAEALNYLKLASHLDAVVSRLNSQNNMQKVSKSMVDIVESVAAAASSFNLQGVARNMDKFQKACEDLDVLDASVSDTLNMQAILSTPQDQVTLLMQQVADEHQLQIQVDMPTPVRMPTGTAEASCQAGRVPQAMQR